MMAATSTKRRERRFLRAKVPWVLPWCLIGKYGNYKVCFVTFRWFLEILSLIFHGVLSFAFLMNMFIGQCVTTPSSNKMP